MTKILLGLLLLIPGGLNAAVISGVVREVGSGAFLAGMTVEAWSTAGVLAGRTTTTASGTYTLTLAAGDYHLLAWDPAGAHATTFHDDAESFDTSTVITLGSGANEKIDLELTRAGWFSGRVLSLDGTPLASMIVAIYNESGTLRGSTTTDATGGWRLVVPAGAYRIAAWDDAMVFLPRFTGGALTFAQASSLSVETSMDVKVDLVLPPAASLSGTVVDAVTLAPLQGMVVEAWTSDGRFVRWGLTDESGRYRLPLEGGSYRLVFSDPAGVYAGAFYGGGSSLTESPLLHLDGGEALDALDAALVHGGRIVGRVVDGRTLLPVEGLQVGAWNADGSLRTLVRTDGAGQYVLVVPPGEFRVGVFDENLVYLTRFLADSATFDAAMPISVIAGADHAQADLITTMGGRIIGTVLSSHGTALPDIVIAAYDGNHSRVATARTDEEGRYVLLLAPGTWHVAAWSEVRPSVVDMREVRSVEGQATREDFVLDLKLVLRRGVRPAPAGARPASLTNPG